MSLCPLCSSCVSATFVLTCPAITSNVSCSNDNKLNLKNKLNKKNNSEPNIKIQASNINKNNTVKIESTNETLKTLNLNIEKPNFESSTIKDKKLIDISMIPTIFSFKYEQKENNHSLALILTLDNLYLKNFINHWMA